MSHERGRIAGVWFYGTLAYCLVVAVAGLLGTHHGGGRAMPSLERVLFAPAMLSFGAQAIYAGQVHVRWGAPADRYDNPISFWIHVGVYMALGCYLLFSGL
jgi:hypothetical protein